jgi:hypothetical protein
MKKFYPYDLQPTDPYHLNWIPVYGTLERIEFFYKYKRISENIYIGNIDSNHLKLSTARDHISKIEDWFLRQSYLDSNVSNKASKRIFPKLCWLTNSLFKNSFDYPVCSHYNPRIQQNVIHPGSIRNLVINWFRKDSPVYCLYFNTGGVDFDFMKNLEIFTKENLISYTKNIEIELVADHGAIIPHINLDSTSVVPNVEKWNTFVYRRLTSPSFTIFCNRDIKILAPWYTSKEDANIEIEIHSASENEYWDDIVCKCAVLSVLGKSYESESFSIKHKLSFDISL